MATAIKSVPKKKPSHRPKLNKRKRKWRLSVLSVIFRLLTWFSIFTIIFNCPSTVDLLNEKSPRICKPYFHLRSIISPHVQPYYDTYAAPYVELARPSYNLAHDLVIEPTKKFVIKYGLPRVVRVQSLAKSYWELILQPQVQKYQSIIHEHYRKTLGPYSDTAYAYVDPYYEAAVVNVKKTYHLILLPTYNAAQPYTVEGIQIVYDFSTNTAYPWAKWAYKAGTLFLCKTVAPTVKTLYSQKVEPQLVRIGERLSRYRDSKNIEQTITEMKSSSLAPSTESISSLSQEVSSSHSTISHTFTEIFTESPVSTASSEQDIREKTQKMVARDLKDWQEKFAKASDEGAKELESRITEITDLFVKTKTGKLGRELIKELEKTVESSLLDLKNDILTIIRESNDTINSEKAIATAMRKAGINVKNRAQAVREWRQKIDAEMTNLVKKAKSETLEILDTIQDAGLQEIGMRWAWTDGITHKDWTTYHTLKTKFTEWHNIIEVVESEHPDLSKAHKTFERIESEAMTIAESTAKDLASLKEIGLRKLSSKDTSDDFSFSWTIDVESSPDQKDYPTFDQISSPQSERTLASEESSFLDLSTSSQMQSTQSLTSTIISSPLDSSTPSPESESMTTSASTPLDLNESI
ncbi:hypothetical protein K3495_g3078 [Podosphaera aphanis]|nr:hypothetical protein K3495_g3078 [Podosphaera aphanis]